MLLTRRLFIRHSVSAVAAFSAGFYFDRPASAVDPAIERFAVSSWSFHNYFPNTRYGKPTFTPTEWTIEDVVRKAKAELHITRIELSSAHLKSFEEKYLDGLNQFMKEQGCRFIHLSDNMRGVNLAKNEGDVGRFLELVEVAAKLGIPTLRVNTGDGKMEDVIPRYKKIAEFAAKKKVGIVIENHFGLSADPNNVARLMKEVGSNISACPDFGLLPKDDGRWPGLETMFAHAKHVCSAKFHGLDEAGKHKDFDLKRCYDQLQKSRYPGWISFEYEGNDEPLPQLIRMKKLATEWLK